MDEFDFDFASTTTDEQPAVKTAVKIEQPAAVTNFSIMPTMPNLQHAKESDVALGSDYWTPQDKGEEKRGIVIGFEIQPYDKVDDRTGEITQIDLKVVIFAEQRTDLTWRRIANGGKRLVATIESAVNSGSIVPYKTPVILRYLGKRKNTTNGFSTDDFEVKTLII